MSVLTEILSSKLGGDALKMISSQLGVKNELAQGAISVAIPFLINSLAGNSSGKEGARALNAALEKDHDGSILDNLGGFLQSSSSGPGAGILGHVLGQKRPQVESYVSKSSGLDQGSTGQLMEMLAPVLMGALGKEKREKGLDETGVAELLKGTRQQVEREQPQSTDVIMKVLDADGDGDISDDLLNMGGKLLGGLFGK